MKFDTLTTDEVKVRVYGDTAVTTGLAKVKGQSGGQDLSGTYRYMNVLVRRGGRWQSVAFQATQVAQQ